MITLLAIAAMFSWAYFELKDNKKPGVDALRLFPSDCIVYMRTRNLAELNTKITSQSLIADKLRTFPELNKLFDAVAGLDSLFGTDDLIAAQLRSNNLHFAWYGAERQWLAAFNVNRLGEMISIRDQMSARFGAEGHDGLYSFRIKGKACFFQAFNGTFLFSGDEDMIRRALRGDEPLSANRTFVENSTVFSENELLSLYLDQSRMQNSPAAKFMKLPVRKGVWSATFGLGPSDLRLNGRLVPGPGEQFNSLKGVPMRSAPEFIGMLPADVITFTAMAISSLQKNNQPDSGSAAVNNSFWDQAEDAAMYDVRTSFSRNINSYLLSFETASGVRCIAAPVMDSVGAHEQLLAMSDSVIATFPVKIHRLRMLNRSPQLLQPHFNLDTRFAAVRNNVIYFSDSLGAIGRVFRDQEYGLLLSKDKSFAAYRNAQFEPLFSYMVYSVPSRLDRDDLRQSRIVPDSLFPSFSNIRHLSFFLVAGQKDFRFRFHIQHEAEGRNPGSGMLWTLGLDTVSVSRCMPFVNHNTGENELLVQDAASNLYLVNAKGKMLWKKKINETIVSEIFRVDAFKNNKFQILFSTALAIHLLDRNGNYVDNYPVKLASPATAGVNVFDYENNRDYRMLIPCADRKIYNYSLTGALTEGFQPFATADIVMLPVKYVKAGSFDHLVAIDSGGKIYALNRRGVTRLLFKNRAIQNCTAFHIETGSNVKNTFIVYVDDKNALINKIYFTDTKEVVKLKKEISDASILFRSLDNQKRTDILITRNNDVFGCTFSGESLIQRTGVAGILASDVYKDQFSAYLLNLSAKDHRLVVYDLLKDKTKIFSSTTLPLVHNLFNDSKKYLIYSNGSQLQCVPLN